MLHLIPAADAVRVAIPAAISVGVAHGVLAAALVMPPLVRLGANNHMAPTNVLAMIAHFFIGCTGTKSKCFINCTTFALVAFCSAFISMIDSVLLMPFRDTHETNPSINTIAETATHRGTIVFLNSFMSAHVPWCCEHVSKSRPLLPGIGRLRLCSGLSQ
jgi:hypothetical protein